MENNEKNNALVAYLGERRQNRVEALRGPLAKKLPSPELIDVDQMTTEEAVDACVALLFVMVYGGNFMAFNAAYRRLMEEYEDLFYAAELDMDFHAKRRRMRSEVEAMNDLTWLTGSATRQRLANAMFVAEVQTTDYLLIKALERVDNEKAGAIRDAVKVMQLRADLVGLAAPKRVDIGVSEKTELSPGHREELRRLAQARIDEASALIELADRPDADLAAYIAEQDALSRGDDNGDDDDDDNVIDGEVV
jgi:hypothetical protein